MKEESQPAKRPCAKCGETFLHAETCIFGNFNVPAIVKGEHRQANLVEDSERVPELPERHEFNPNDSGYCADCPSGWAEPKDAAVHQKDETIAESQPCELCIDGKISAGCSIDKPLLQATCPACKGAGRVPLGTKQSVTLDIPKNDPTRFLERGFAVVENSNHSIRLIDRNDARQAISIKWRDLPALAELIKLMLKDDRPVGPPPATRESLGVEGQKCPFKVGDRVRYKEEMRGNWPDATVTEVIGSGFTYEYDEPYVLGTRLGSTTGGQTFVSDHWELAPTSPQESESAASVQACPKCGKPMAAIENRVASFECKQCHIAVAPVPADASVQAGPELLPCPFCGDSMRFSIPDDPRTFVEHVHGDRQCPLTHKMGRLWAGADTWNTRATPPPTEPSVEQCGDELRQLWPGCSYQIKQYTAAGFYKPSETWYEMDIISTDYKLHGEHFKGNSLAECMAAAREFKAKEKENG